MQHMPREMNSVPRRLAIAIALYGGLALMAGVTFYSLRQGAPHGSPVRYAYILCGPALSLFTHMSYPLFVFQTALVLPWLLLGAVWKRTKTLSALGFIVSWLAIGWRMYDLF